MDICQALLTETDHAIARSDGRINYYDLDMHTQSTAWINNMTQVYSSGVARNVDELIRRVRHLLDAVEGIRGQTTLLGQNRGD